MKEKLFPQGAEVSLTIDEYPKGDPRERKTVFNYKTKPFEEKNKGILLIEETFPANVGYTLTDWKEGVDLSKEDEDLVRKEIEKKYIDFTATFKNQDLSKYKEITELRQEKAFISMYYDYKQKKLAEKS